VIGMAERISERPTAVADSRIWGEGGAAGGRGRPHAALVVAAPITTGRNQEGLLLTTRILGEELRSADRGLQNVPTGGRLTDNSARKPSAQAREIQRRSSVSRIASASRGGGFAGERHLFAAPISASSRQMIDLAAGV